MSVRIVTDSTAVLPTAMIEQLRIAVAPLTIMWDDVSYRDGVDISYERFAELVEHEGTAPKTSAPSPGEYAATYEQVLADGADGIVVVTPPAELSVTHSNATLAAQLAGEDRVTVVDSRSAAAGQGLVVLEAARAASAGAGLEAVASRTRHVLARVGLVATLERLDYLRRSGRVPAVAVYATDALHLHPVFRFVDGSPTAMGAARGGRRAADRIVAEWEKSRPDDAARCHIAVFHSSRAEHAGELRARLEEASPGAETFVVEATAAMGAHLGPGALGVAWWWEPPAA